MLWVLKRDGSFEHPKQILKLVDKKIFSILLTNILFILRIVRVKNNLNFFISYCLQSTMIELLKPYTSYMITIQAINDVGKGPAAVVKIKTAQGGKNSKQSSYAVRIANNFHML